MGIDEAHWDAYTADIAKELVVKIAEKYEDPREAAEYAVWVAKEITKRLKAEQYERI